MSELPTSVAGTSPSDLELLGQVAKDRNESAFEILMRRHQAAAFNLAVHLTRNREQAEDALQEAMLRAWSAAGSYRTEGSVRSWLLRIVVRECIKQHRRTVSERNRVMRIQESGRREAAGSQGESEQADHLEVLRRLIAELTYPQRAMLAMYFGAGLTHDDIGAELDMPRSTIALRIRESLDTLRRRMARHGIEALPAALAPALVEEAVLNGEGVPSSLLDTVRLKMLAAVPDAGIAGRHSGRAFGAPSPSPRRWLPGQGWIGAALWTGAALVLATGALAYWPRADEGNTPESEPVLDAGAPNEVVAPTGKPIPPGKPGTVLRTIELEKDHLYYGLACDGSNLWTCRGQRGPGKKYRYRLAKLDLKTESVVAFGPDLGDRQYTGLDWDGKHLWAIDSKGRKLLQLDGSSGEPLREISLELPGSQHDPWGVAVVPGKDIWVCDLHGGFYRLDYQTGKVDSTLKPALNINLTWIELANPETALVQGWMPRRQPGLEPSPEFGHHVLRLDLATGKTSWLCHLSESHASADAAVDGAGRLWVLNKVEKRIRLYDLSESQWGAAGSIP